MSAEERVVAWRGDRFWRDGDGVGRDHWTNQPLFVLRRTAESLKFALARASGRSARGLRFDEAAWLASGL